MKYPADVYANAFLQVLERAGKRAEESIIKSFAALVRKNGDIENYGRIFLEIEKLIAKKEGGKYISIEVARDGESARRIANLFSDKDAVKIRTAPELLAGARVLIDQEFELDFSFERRLNDLFTK